MKQRSVSEKSSSVFLWMYLEGDQTFKKSKVVLTRTLMPISQDLGNQQSKARCDEYKEELRTLHKMGNIYWLFNPKTFLGTVAEHCWKQWNFTSQILILLFWIPCLLSSLGLNQINKGMVCDSHRLAISEYQQLPRRCAAKN